MNTNISIGPLDQIKIKTFIRDCLGNSYKFEIQAWVFMKSCGEYKITYSHLKFSYSDCGFLGRVKEELWIKWKFMQIEQPTATKKKEGISSAEY